MVNLIHQYQARKGDESEQGFTLIELLIVIVVLGILAGVTVFALGGVTQQSSASACNADAKTVDVAVAAFKAQTSAALPTTPALWQSALVPTYMQSFPSATSTHYIVSISAAGVVMVQAPPAATAVAYDTTNTCASAA
jgi:prepilin-type N-terminal cleavage/methylation domain-containing protein